MKRIRISGYTVSFNCITHDSPLVPSIRSMLGFCDEVVVVDAGSSDGTIDLLHEIARTDPRLRVVREFVDIFKGTSSSTMPRRVRLGDGC
jgi:GT2 family glycosyltransferase